MVAVGAAVSDIAHPNWRDPGYGIGAPAPSIVASFNGVIEQAFWFVAVSMLLSGLVVQLGEETHPRLNQEVLPVHAWHIAFRKKD